MDELKLSRCCFQASQALILRSIMYLTFYSSHSYNLRANNCILCPTFKTCLITAYWLFQNIWRFLLRMTLIWVHSGIHWVCALRILKMKEKLSIFNVFFCLKQEFSYSQIPALPKYLEFSLFCIFLCSTKE